MFYVFSPGFFFPVIFFFHSITSQFEFFVALKAGVCNMETVWLPTWQHRANDWQGLPVHSQQTVGSCAFNNMWTLKFTSERTNSYHKKVKSREQITDTSQFSLYAVMYGFFSRNNCNWVLFDRGWMGNTSDLLENVKGFTCFISLGCFFRVYFFIFLNNIPVRVFCCMSDRCLKGNRLSIPRDNVCKRLTEA